ncbi:hypothetical protein K490DRAFT_70650 [Saccharata proteae CBS 121410]|uniref:Meiotically up-regulated gene 154 protein n=1 Tax=Saccharata proteae CBS 121410 TaxID=1314787 RepID=A0A9P4M264_9PEZI|nr:hypothetical protein K490DRAFT_70650 [Saccharata proteae CBS 121410]
MPPLVRRRPLSERVQAYLNAYDWLLWASEEINGNDWDEALKDWIWPIGLTVNLLFMIARANSGAGESYSDSDDVFGDSSTRRGTGWLAWICSFIVYSLFVASVFNAFRTFYRKRSYRLFEKSVDRAPTTPSARRVRVDSSPLASSPLRFFSNIMQSVSAESRAHPDAQRDVWEISVWDPTPTCLRLFCLFSPGHALVYWLFLPVAELDSRPSVKVATAITLSILMTVQLSLLHMAFAQQSKDTTLIQKEVFHEYDTKYVHPSLHRPVRSVSVQTPPSAGMKEVTTFKPTTVINRGFRTNPNPAYASQYDPDNVLNADQRVSRTASTAVDNTPTNTDYRRRRTNMRQPQFRPQNGSPAGDGGSLGVFTHANSPLRKPAGGNFLRPDESRGGPSPTKREGSPLKRVSTPSNFSGANNASIAAYERQRRSYQGGLDERRESGRF